MIIPDTSKGFERPQSHTDDGPVSEVGTPPAHAQVQSQFQQFQPQMINPQIPQFGQQGQLTPQMQFAMMQQQQQQMGQFRPSIVEGTRLNPSPPEFFPPRVSQRPLKTSWGLLSRTLHGSKNNHILQLSEQKIKAITFIQKTVTEKMFCGNVLA